MQDWFLFLLKSMPTYMAKIGFHISVSFRERLHCCCVHDEVLNPFDECKLQAECS